MRPGDWLVFSCALAYVVLYGLWKARGHKSVRSFVVASRSVPWYAVGLSIMATQASAITFISTTGQGYVDGMRFVQFYFGLPIAMLILSVHGGSVLPRGERLSPRTNISSVVSMRGCGP